MVSNCLLTDSHGAKPVVSRTVSVEEPTLPDVVGLGNKRPYMIYKDLADGTERAIQVSEGGLHNEEKLLALSSTTVL